jgi:hypothetical protein
MNHAFSSLLGVTFVFALAAAGCASRTPAPTAPAAAAPSPPSDGVANNQPPPNDDFVFVEKDQKRSAADDKAPATDLHPTEAAAHPKSW